MDHLKVTLDDEYAQKLSRLAARAGVQPGTIARWLLSTALDEADIDPRNAVELVNGIPGARDRAQLGRMQAEAGDTIPLEDL